jgi:hypothetical protein
LVSLRLQAPGQVQDYERSTTVVLSPDNPFVYTGLTRAVAAAATPLECASSSAFRIDYAPTSLVVRVASPANYWPNV